MKNKIFCVGDSITKGKVWNLNERRPFITKNSYPVILKDLLDMDVENDGICNVTSEDMLLHIGKDIVLENGGIAIIEIGGNDCNPNWREVKKDPDGRHEGTVPIDRFKTNLAGIIDAVKKYGAIPILSTLPPLDGDRYYNLLKRFFGDTIKKWIDKNGGIYKWQERYSDLVKATSEKLGVYLIDIRKAFLDTTDYRNYMSLDGIHPNEQGYQLIANTCFHGLCNILA
ncbi:MAG: SGNH/GDSL hydrolase family protein [Clostridiales bacterium]|nr:SGNH/GDSL hydrolase family protein [Clostridiales bacterium]